MDVEPLVLPMVKEDEYCEEIEEMKWRDGCAKQRNGEEGWENSGRVRRVKRKPKNISMKGIEKWKR